MPQIARAILVAVDGLSGPLCQISADEDWSVAQLKEAVYGATGIFVSLQRLLHGHIELFDAQLLVVLLPACQVLPDHAVDVTLIKRPSDFAQWFEKVARQPLELRSAPEHIRADRDIVLAAVKHDGRALEFACQPLQCDSQVVTAAVAQHSGAFAFAAPHLKEDFAFVMQIVRTSGCALASASAPLLADTKIVTAALLENEYSIQYAAKHLKEDKTFLLPVVKKNPHLLPLLNQKFRNDPDFQRTRLRAA